MALSTLPGDFLSQPGPTVNKVTLDWTETTLPEYKGAYAVVLDNVLTPEECAKLVSAAEAHNNGTWDVAMLRSGLTSSRLAPEVRKGSRILWDSDDVASRLWARVAPHVPELTRIVNKPMVLGNRPTQCGEIWECLGLNERLRFLQYGPGDYFRPHEDGAFERPDAKGRERTLFTVHLYLNERDEKNALEGGATSFHHVEMDEAKEVDVCPKIGRVLVFQHRGLLHSGQEVKSGLKLTLRSDLMFRRSSEVLPEEERVKVGPRVKSKYQYWTSRKDNGTDQSVSAAAAAKSA